MHEQGEEGEFTSITHIYGSSDARLRAWAFESDLRRAVRAHGTSNLFCEILTSPSQVYSHRQLDAKRFCLIQATLFEIRDTNGMSPRCART